MGTSENLQRTKRMEELGAKLFPPDAAELAGKEVADSYNLTVKGILLKISIISLKENVFPNSGQVLACLRIGISACFSS